MIPYYLTIIAVAMTSYAAQTCNGKSLNPLQRFRAYPGATRFLLLLTILILVLISGLRYNVGTDFGAYYKAFDRFGDLLESSITRLDEPWLPVITNFVALFSNNGTWVLIICASLTIGLPLIAAYRESNKFTFITLLFIFVGCWHGSFNGVRQYLAAAFCFAGYRYILEKKFWKYAIFVFLGFCAHRSAIVMIILYFLLNNKISVINLLLLAAGTYLVATNLDRVFQFVGFLKEQSMDRQLANYSYYTHSVNFLRVAVSMAPVFLSLYLHRGWHYGKEDTFYTNALIVNAAALIATSNSAYLARLSIYTGMYLPICYAKLIVFEDKRKEGLLKAAIIILYAIFWYVEVSGGSALKTYQWVLSQ